jgi:Flp pilus assembly protein TadG
MFNRLRLLLRRGRGEEGAVAVELGIILPVLLLLILGGMDLGHMYYIKHIITNASREGARYAAKYTLSSDDPTTDAISNYVKLPAGLNYNSFNLSNLVVSEVSTGVSPNKIVTVTVNAKKHWWLLGNLPGVTDPTQLTAKTAMTSERP